MGFQQSNASKTLLNICARHYTAMNADRAHIKLWGISNSEVGIRHPSLSGTVLHQSSGFISNGEKTTKHMKIWSAKVFWCSEIEVWFFGSLLLTRSLQARLKVWTMRCIWFKQLLLFMIYTKLNRNIQFSPC